MTKTIDPTTFRKYIFSYALLAFASTIYWADNYSNHTSSKGDEFFFLATFLLTLTSVLYIIQLNVIRQLKYWFLLLVPFLTIFSSFGIGLLMFFVFSLTGTPTETVYIYGYIYSLTNILFSSFILSRLKKEKANTFFALKTGAQMDSF